MKLSLKVTFMATVLLVSANSAMADQRHYQHNNGQHNNSQLNNGQQHHGQQQHSRYNNKHRYQHQQNDGNRVVVTKEVTENGVIIHKTITEQNGVTYTIDKKIEHGPRGSVDIEKRRNGRVIEQQHHSR